MRRLILLSFCLALAGCGRSAASPSPSVPKPTPVQSLMSRAEEHQRRGASLEAEQYLIAAWDTGVKQALVLPRLLEVCLGSGRLQNARLHVERARREEPDDLYLPYLDARLLYALGHVMEALEQINELTGDSDAPAEAWLFQGALLFETGADSELARSSLVEFLRRKPSPASSRQVRALLRGGERHD